MSEHIGFELACRPSITGAATLALASEETFLVRVRKHLLDNHYREVILPTKCTMDAEYMACATFVTDVRLLAKTVLRQWDTSILDYITAPEMVDEVLKAI